MMDDGSRIASLRAEVEAAIAAADHATARTALERLWREHPGPSVANFVAQRSAKLPATQYRRSAKVAILRSCTVEPLVPVLRAAAAVGGLDLTVEVGGFNTYAQELLDPSSPVYTSWAPDVVVVFAATRDIAPELWDGFAELDPEGVTRVTDRVVAELTAQVTNFRGASTASLVLHGLDVPASLAYGVADASMPVGQATAIADVNRRLGEVCAGLPGVHLLDYDAVVAARGRRDWYDERKWASMRMPFGTDSMAPLADAWLRLLQPLVGRVAKALICDLDNTLWGGVVGEDGVEGIRLGHDVAGSGFHQLQRSIRDLLGRGVLLGICSKNNPADVDEVFERHPEMVLRRDDFVAVRVNWEDKASNLRSIAAELNIGIDSLAFIDDNPAECALIRHELPEVMVIELSVEPTAAVNPIAGNPMFERLTLSTEDRDRTRYYQQQRERAESAASITSLDDYLHSLGTTVSVRLMGPADLARAAQLTNKTNQLNVTTRRYTEQQVQAFADGETSRVYVVQAADRFGDHGTIGLMITETDGPRWLVDTLLLSCRVIGRGVERAMLSVVVDDAHRAGADEVLGTFIPTAKNAPATELFAGSGFADVGRDGDTSHWRRLAADHVDVPEWIALTAATEPTMEDR